MENHNFLNRKAMPCKPRLIERPTIFDKMRRK